MAGSRVQCVVVGAGVIGLSVARALRQRGVEVLVLEKALRAGESTSARSSEVIHAGLYYKPGSLKARLCVEGRRKLYQFCEEREIPHQNCGKLLVACDDGEQREKLHALRDNALKNGVEGLKMMSAEDAKAMEPQLRCTEALFSETTGIVDSHAFMEALQADGPEGMFVFNTRVEAVRVANIVGRGIPRFEVLTSDAHMHAQAHAAGTEEEEGEGVAELARIGCDMIVNCAGLDAIPLANRTLGMPRLAIPSPHYCKGSYFKLVGGPSASPFSTLVYPMPNAYGIGVHSTLDMSGCTRFGPDVEWLDVKRARLYDELAYAPTLTDNNRYGILWNHDNWWHAYREARLPADTDPEDGAEKADSATGLPSLTAFFRRRRELSKTSYISLRAAASAGGGSGSDDEDALPLPPPPVLPSSEDVEDIISYAVEEHRREAFFEEIRQYWPVELSPDDLQPDYSGVRPKIQGPGDPPQDFGIQGYPQHGIDGLVQCLGMESPGLTSSLAIGDYVADLLLTE